MRTSFFVLLLIAVATSARAQAPASSLFVEGALLGDFDSSQRRSDFEPAALGSAGGSGAIGFQAGHFTARFEAEVPAFHSSPINETYAGLTRAEVASFRTVTYGALFGGRFRPHRKVELAALAGFSDAIQENRFSGYDESFLPNGAVVRNEINSRSSYRRGIHSRRRCSCADDIASFARARTALPRIQRVRVGPSSQTGRALDVLNSLVKT
jgi:hypothetical protein